MNKGMLSYRALFLCKILVVDSMQHNVNFVDKVVNNVYKVVIFYS